MPIHVASFSRRYIRKYYDPDVVVRDIPMLERVIKIGADRAAYCRYNDRLPLHYALDCGKTWYEIRPMVSKKRRTVRTRDPITKLYPFQLAASRVALDADDMEWLSLKVRNRQDRNVWENLLKEEQNGLIEDEASDESLRRLHTVYELLRRSPMTLFSTISSTNHEHF